MEWYRKLRYTITLEQTATVAGLWGQTALVGGPEPMICTVGNFESQFEHYIINCLYLVIQLQP